MAILPLGPAAPAAVAPVGMAAAKADAGLTVGGMRDMLSVVREFVSLWKEAEPILRAMRPPPPPEPEYEPERLPPRAPAPEVAERRASAPPPSEIDAARAEEVARARADLEKLVNERLSKAHILQLVAAFGPLAIGEKMPKLGEALANHATETDAWLSAFSEDELRAIICEALPLIPSKDVAMARGAMLSAVKSLEAPPPPAPAEPAPEPAPAGEPKGDESA